MTVQVNDIIRVDVIGDFNATDDVVNVYHWRIADFTPRDDADVLDDLEAILEALYNAIKALWTVLHVFRKVRVQNVTQGLLLGEKNFSPPIAGESAGEPAATQVAALVSLKTNIPRVVGRKYIPISEVQMGGTGLLTAGAITLMETLGSALLVTQTAPSGHQYRYTLPRPFPVLFRDPNSRSVSPVPATQRRRRQGVGS